MTDPKTPQSQLQAAKSYRNRGLANVTFVISENEQSLYDALQVIKQHHKGKPTPAIKAAIIEYAKSLATKKAD